MGLEAKTDRCHGIAVLSLVGELDVTVKDDLAAAIDEVSDANTKLVVDLGEVTFVDSSALGLMIDLDARLTARDGMLAIACLQPPVQRVFEVAGLVRLLRVFEDTERAALYLSQDPETR